MNSIQERSVDTEFIYRRLIQARPGETISYEELCNIIGRDPRYSTLNAARTLAEKENGIVFGTIQKIGIKRLTDSDIVKTSLLTIKKTSRMARNGKKRLHLVEYDALSAEDKIVHNTNMTLLSFSIESMKPSMQKKIQSIVQNSNGPLPVGRTLELFT